MATDHFISDYSSYEDIIFENRNKSFGAYDIRKKHNRALFIGLCIAISLYSFLLTLHQSKSIPKEIDPFEQHIDIGLIPIVPVLKPQTHHMKTTKEPEKKDLGNIHMSRDRDDNVDMAKDKDRIAPIKGDRDGAGIQASSGNGTDGAGPNLSIRTIKNDEPQEVVHNPWDPSVNPPTFPGGEKAMINFIENHTHFSDIGLQTSGQGTVYISFVISKDGKINDIKIIKNPGYGFDEEAIKTIKSMPDWIPGDQNGQKISVRITIPIKFTLR